MSKRRNKSGMERVPLLFNTANSIFYGFDANALTRVIENGYARTCSLCKFKLVAYEAQVVRTHYETGDDAHRSALKAYLSRKVLSYQ